MEKNKASLTSLMSAFGRAFHAEQAENPVFADTKVKELMTPEEYTAIGTYIADGISFFAPEQQDVLKSKAERLRYLVNTQIAPTPLARARYCEDSLDTAALTGTAQYVILGAGLDTFAFRRPDFLSKHAVFEVDHPKTQEDKQARIRAAGWEIPENLHFVPMDFTVDNLQSKLEAAGFDGSRKTFFSWLGVSYYLTEPQIRAMLGTLSEFAADGSTLLFDYADETLFTSEIRRVKNMIMMAAAAGEPMHTCLSEEALTRLLEAYDFRIYELLTDGDIQNRYFRDKTEALTAFEHIHYVQAVLKK